MNENQVPETNKSAADLIGDVQKVMDEVKHAGAPLGAGPQKRVQRGRKTAKREPLRLPAVVLSDGSKDSSLEDTVSKKYLKIQFVTPDGKKVHATVQTDDPKVKADNLGSSMYNFTLALINATLAGQGSGPDASALYVTKNWTKVLAHWGKGFENYRLRVVPAGRAGAAIYESTISRFMDIAKAKALVIEESIKKHGAAKKMTVKRPEVEEAAPSITF